MSCSKKEETQIGKHLKLSLTSEVSTLDPAKSYDNISGAIIYNVYEPLFEYHYLNRPYELKPLLAESMPQIENGGRRYIIKIKKNIRYHDHPAFHGSPRYVRADDFVNAFKRLAFSPLQSTGWWVLDGVVVGANEFRKTVGEDFQKFKTTPIVGVKAPSDHVLIIELNQPSPQFIYKLAMSFLSPIPLEVLEAEHNNLSSKMVGTGAYTLSSFEANHLVRLQKFPYHHEQYYPSEGDRFANVRGLLKDSGEKIPFIDTISFSIIKENKQRYEKFLKNELDIIFLPQEFFNQVFDELGNLKENIRSTDIRLQTMPTLTYWWLAFNMRDPILGKNLNLRKAIAHAIDMNQYIQKFTNNTGQLANSILPPGIFGYDPQSSLSYSYNLNLARDYLSKAGYPNGKNLPELIYDTRAESKISEEQALFCKDQLAQIGIRLKIVKNSFNKFLEKSRKGQLQFYQDGWTLDYPDAENIYQLLISTNFPPGSNASFYSNKDIDQMYDRLSKMNDGDEKKKLLTQMEKKINEDVPWVMQYYSRNFILYHDRVKNYRPSDLIGGYPKYLRIH